MSHLMKTVDGHLAKGASGHLAKCCKCNDCDPPIPCVLCVTFSGLAGDFAPWNGPNIVTHDRSAGSCVWGDNLFTPPYLYVSWTTQWNLTLVIGSNCGIQFTGPDTPCDPRGAYTQHDCFDSECVDRNSCEDSVGATAGISYGECI